MSAPIFNAERVLPCQNILGEGVVWDEKRELLHWVDIIRAEVHTFDPVTHAHAVQVYPEFKHITAVTPAPHYSEPSLVAMTEHSVVLLPQAPPPTVVDGSGNPTITVCKATSTLSRPLREDLVQDGRTRFNDGACDAAGRLFAGSMSIPEFQDGVRVGELWRITADGSSVRVLDGIGTGNGIGWSPDSELMYYIDSSMDEISVFDYDLSSGTISNRRVFTGPPPSIEGHTTSGTFDGLTVDGAGNVWAARWNDERLVGFDPNGRVIAHIKVPKCKSPTIPCFGGKDLTTMYIASAHAKLANGGDESIQAAFPHSGDLFKIECARETSLGAVLGDGWCGKARHTFGFALP